MRTYISRSGQRTGPGLRSGNPAPAGGRDPAFCTVRLIDLPHYDTDSDPIEKRLTAFLGTCANGACC